MDSLSVDELAQKKDRWYRIVEEMLAEAGVAINGPRADIRVHNPALFKRILQEGSLGFGESYMDGWWECERLDMLFTRILQAGVDERLPKSLSDIARVAYARLFNRQSRKRAGRWAKSTTTSATTCSGRCSILTCNTPAATGKRRRRSSKRSRPSCG